MTTSIWRFAHLALALSIAVFLFLAALSGAILAVEAIDNKLPNYEASTFEQLTVADVLPVLQKKYTEITEITVSEQHFVLLKAQDQNGKKVEAYINPSNGDIVGTPKKTAAFYQWVTAFHRSLFLKSIGRIFIGITSFLLVLIAISGIVLVVQQQLGLRRFFAKIIKEHFAQYYHVLLGRIMLIPIILIATTGVYLSLYQFNFFSSKKVEHAIVPKKNQEALLKKPLHQFAFFKTTPLSNVRSIQFPFFEDPEEYYTCKLRNKEVIINQYNGAIESEVMYPFAQVAAAFSLQLHTGRSSILWAIILGVASTSILFFMYSGFAITLKRKRAIIKNKFNSQNATHVILVGSEKGSTWVFAKALHQQLLAKGVASFVSSLNNYTSYPQAQCLLVCTSTYGLGEAPTNAAKFLALLQTTPQSNKINFAVMGFGSRAYPDFCLFAQQVHACLSQQTWATPKLPLHTVNDKSEEQFNQWLLALGNSLQLPLQPVQQLFTHQRKKLQQFVVVQKTALDNTDATFSITLQPIGRASFASGDLLAIYPANDGRERLYSIAKVKGQIQLVVKYVAGGLGSAYLHQLQEGSMLQAALMPNPNFHFPQQATAVIMIANGTGIAPFLGMLQHRATNTLLFAGFRQPTSLVQNFQQQIQQHTHVQAHYAFSKTNATYVMDLLERHAATIASLLASKAVVMLCGSLAMQQAVEAKLHQICMHHNQHPLSFYKEQGQVISDCY